MSWQSRQTFNVFSLTLYVPCHGQGGHFWSFCAPCHTIEAVSGLFVLPVMAMENSLWPLYGGIQKFFHDALVFLLNVFKTSQNTFANAQQWPNNHPQVLCAPSGAQITHFTFKQLYRLLCAITVTSRLVSMLWCSRSILRSASDSDVMSRYKMAKDKHVCLLRASVCLTEPHLASFISPSLPHFTGCVADWL